MSGPSTSSTTAGQLLFPAEGAAAQSAQLQRQIEADTTTSGRLLSKVGLRVAVTELCDALDGLLHIDLGGVLAGGWKTHKALLDAGARTAATPGSSEVVEIGRHKVTSTHHPTIDIWVDDVRVSTLVFDLTLTFDTHALVAVVREGYLTSARPGKCDVSGELTLMSVSLAREQTTLQLPGEIDFGASFPLVRLPLAPRSIDITEPTVLERPT